MGCAGFGVLGAFADAAGVIEAFPKSDYPTLGLVALGVAKGKEAPETVLSWAAASLVLPSPRPAALGVCATLGAIRGLYLLSSEPR